MLYDAQLRNHQSTHDFDHNTACVWVVYPDGCAGDLWAAIIGYHYPRTGNQFLGIDTTGKVILNTVDHKWCNFKLMEQQGQDPVDLGQSFIDIVNQGYLSQNFPRSLGGQTIFANHMWADHHVADIVCRFANAQVVRILPTTAEDIVTVSWMSQWKNQNQICNLDAMEFDQNLQSTIANTKFTHDRVLTIPFNLMWSPMGYETVYDRIVQHLKLPYKLVKYDLIRFWFDCQHEVIKPRLAKLFAD
jgi:hypothetical protein